jgi:von Willebrand factor type A domain
MPPTTQRARALDPSHSQPLLGRLGRYVGSVLALGCMFAGLLSSASCTDTRPPFVSFNPIRDNDSGPPPVQTLVPEGGTLRCGLPIDEVCECTEMPLKGDPPNLYFILDHSGSMARDNLWTNVSQVLLETVRRLGPRSRYGVAFFPKSGSDGCDAGNEVMSLRQGDAPAGSRGPVWQQLRAATLPIPPAGGTPLGATLLALQSKLVDTAQQSPGKTYVILATDGAPNCNDTLRCNADKCSLNIEQVGACSLATPNCCTDIPGACVDDERSTKVLSELRAKNIQTYVMGIPGSGPYADVLRRFAQAGGTNQASPDGYFRVDNGAQANLARALNEIVASVVGSCTIDLDVAPSDPARLNVYLDGVVLPQAGADGWSYENKTTPTVRIQGESCKRIERGDILDVRVIAGCKTITVN